MTPTPEPTELDCSAGAKMMIERMKTNPEDFEIGGKLYRVYETHRMSVRDKKAVGDAYGEYIVEPQLMAAVLVALTAPEESEMEMIRAYSAGRGGGKSAFGTTSIDTRALYGNQVAPFYDPNTQTYNTATQQLISHEMIEQQRRHLADHKQKMRYLQEQKERAAQEEKLSWPEKIKGMF